jgi:hypothetical protein
MYRKLYAQFLSRVLNDEAGARRQLCRAKELEGETDDTVTLTDTRNCIMIISGEKENLGQVLEANKRTCDAFERLGEDIIGKKVNALMARCFSLIHNSFLMGYIERKDTNLTDVSRKGMMMKNSSGFLFECDLQVREYANFTLEPSIAFFGLIKPLAPKMFCIVKQSDLVIWDISREYFNFFNSNMHRLRSYELKIIDDIPRFVTFEAELKESIEQGEAFTFLSTYRRAGTLTELKVLVEPLLYYTKEFYRIEIETQKRGALGGDSVAASVATSRTSFFSGKRLTKKKGLVTDSFTSTLTITKSGVEMNQVHQIPIEEKSSFLSLPKDDQRQASSASYSLTESEDMEVGSLVDTESTLEDEVRSTTSSIKSTGLLRMGLHRNSGKLDRTLKRLLSWMFSLIGLLVIMAFCVQVLWSVLNIQRFNASIDILRSPIQAGITTATYSALIYDHMMRGTFFNSSESKAAEDERIRRDMTNFQAHFDTFRTSFYRDASSLSPIEVSYIKDTTAQVVSYDGDLVSPDLTEIIHHYSVAMTMILNRNMTELFKDTRPLQFMITNRNNSVSDIWNSICELILEQQDDTSDRIQRIELIFMVSAIILVLLVSATVFLPTVYVIVRRNADILSFLERLEYGNLRSVFSSCMEKLSEVEGIEAEVSSLEMQDLSNVIESKRMQHDSDVKTSTTPRVKIRWWHILLNRMTLGVGLILACTVLYFSGCYVWWRELRHTELNSVDARVYQAVMREYYVRRIMVELMTYDPEQAQYAIDFDRLRVWEEGLWKCEHGLYYGDTDLKIDIDVRFIKGGYDILMKDLCSNLEQGRVNAYNNTPCESFSNGILTRSGHEVVISFLILVEDLKKCYTLGQMHLFEEKLAVIKELADYWLPQVYLIYNQWIQNAFMVGFSQASNVRVIVTVCFICSLCLSVFLLHYPIVQSMNTVMLQTRNMLLVIPPDVMDSSAELKEAVRKLAIKMVQNV